MLKSFKPLVDRRSRVLILGTMPGPVALARREYYGFPGNHFWPIMARLFGAREPLAYPRKVRLLKKNRVALWDTIASCERAGASDGKIRRVAANDVPALIRRYPGIRVVFLNGRLAEKLYRKHSAHRVRLPTITLPSTSPAHAAMSFQRKLKAWSVVKKLSGV
ncbi:MAG: DNA-deoxyinosine glycosylase [Candidatus Omnitrophica bacterium]|nr:DNA-deoxyinosine glycosylase [Candidatus Omnitrophota bacterium]